MEKQIIEEVEKLIPELIESVCQLVNQKSVKDHPQPQAPYGKDIANTLDFVLNISQELGFETKNIDYHMGYASYGKTNTNDYICAIGHIDVVPTGIGWDTPPFQATIKDGRIYGRGVLDNKGPILSCLYGLYALKKLNLKLNNEVRIIFGCDEESGFNDLKYYLTKQQPPIMGFTPDCKYPVVYSERGRAVIDISIHDQKLFYQFLNEAILNTKNDGQQLGIAYFDEEYGHLEVRNFQIINEDNLTLRLSVSYPASIRVETILQNISNQYQDFTVNLYHNFNPVRFEKDNFLVKTLESTYNDVMDCNLSPVTTTGGTYAKLMPNIVPFGPSFPGQKGIAHLPNEWMNIDDLIMNAKIYALSLYRLGQGGKNND